MATGHALSMVTNSCVKPPINPKTRLACTFAEREDAYASSGDQHLSKTWPERGDEVHENGSFDNVTGDPDEYHADGIPYTSFQFHGTEDALFQSLTDDLGRLSDDQFYEKLLELKDEHQKTLKSLESAYNSRHTSPRDIHVEELPGPRPQTKHLSQSGPIYNHGGLKMHQIDDQIKQLNQSMPAWSALKKDNVRDMSAKPPSGRPRSAWSDRSKRPGHSLRGSRTHNDWHDITWTSDSENDTSAASDQNTSINTTSTDGSRARGRAFQDSPVAVVENMWDNFSVDDYAPRSRSGSESKASFRSNRSTSSKKSQEWSPKITVPKPFTMTMRDANKEKKKSRACEELEQELEERKKAEEAECQKQFKATPAPATTYLPLYDELMEKQAERNHQNQEMSKDILKSTQKPFKFMRREEEKKRHRTRSLPLATPESKTKVKKQFKARPVPKSVHDPTVSERILEEEEYRKIRIRMRAEDMLRSSSLPPNMQVRGKEYTDGHQRQKLQKSREKKAFLTKEHKFHPKVKGEVPDYDELYRKFQAEAYRKRQAMEPTVVQPFNLRTARIPSKKDKILEDMRLEEERRKEEARGGFSLTKSGSLRRSLSTSADSIPQKTTATSELRKSVTLKSLKQKAEEERKAIEKERQQRLKEKRLQLMITQKALANDKSETLAETNRDKLRKYRQSERSRQEEYDRELQEIMSRVESRPFLFERESQTNAQKKAERQYQRALRDAGIDEDFLVRKSRGAPSSSVASRDPYTDDDDFERSDSILGGLNSVRSDRSRGSARKTYSDDDGTISSIHTDEDED